MNSRTWARFALPALATGVTLLVGIGAGQPAVGARRPVVAEVQLPRLFPLPVPMRGNVTLVRVRLDIRSTGASLPADVDARLQIVNPQQLTPPMLITGAATISRSATLLRYDGFLGLINRRVAGSSGGGLGLGLQFAVAGTDTGAAQITPSAVSVANAVGGKAPATFCRAAAADAASPARVAFVDPNRNDAAPSPASRLALARAAARLCGGGSHAVATMNRLLGSLGRGSVQAVPPAYAAALQILRPERERGIEGNVAVFAAPLRAGQTVSEASTGRRLIRPSRRAWLFWEDLGYTLLTPHASRLVLVDAAGRRPLYDRRLFFFPLIDGRVPQFLKTTDAYLQAPDGIYVRSLTLPLAADRSAPLRSPARHRLETVDFSNDAVITVGDRSEGFFNADIEAVEKAGRELVGKNNVVSVKKKPGEALYDTLRKAIADVIEKKKRTDILLYVTGHGFPEHDVYETGADGKPVLDAEGKPKVAHPASKAPSVNIDVNGKYAEALTAGGLDRLLKAFPQATFKIVIESCFSGRFLATLMANKNVVSGVTSAPADKPSHSGFGQVFAAGLLGWAKAGNPPDLAGGVSKALDSDSVKKNNELTGDRPQAYTPPVSSSPVLRIHADFVQAQSSTRYTVVATGLTPPLEYAWALTPPPNDPGCNNRGVVRSAAAEFVWYHGDDVCNHGVEAPGLGHVGRVDVTVADKQWTCKAAIGGTATADSANATCARR